MQTPTKELWSQTKLGHSDLEMESVCTTEHVTRPYVCVCVRWSGDLDSLVDSARFLLLLSKLYQKQSRYEDRLTYMTKAKDIQDRSVM